MVTSDFNEASKGTSPSYTESSDGPFLVFLRADPDSGIDKKMRGIAAALRSKNADVHFVLGSKDRREGLRDLRRALSMQPPLGTVFIRSDYIAVFCLPQLIRLRRHGMRLFVDQYDPEASRFRESRTPGLSMRTPLEFLKAMLVRFSARCVWLVADSVFTYADDDWLSSRLLSGKEIRVQNGVDVDAISPRQLSVADNGVDLPLRVLALGSYRVSHGLDRVIRGMARAASSGYEDIHLIVVGDGPVRPQLEQLVEQLGLQHRVELRGIANGRELDRLFDWAEVGLGTLAAHRIGEACVSSIKVREYLARGLPVVIADSDVLSRDTKDSAQFIFVVDDDESDLDLGDVKRTLRQCNPIEISEQARQFAEQRLCFWVTHGRYLSGSATTHIS